MNNSFLNENVTNNVLGQQFMSPIVTFYVMTGYNCGIIQRIFV